MLFLVSSSSVGKSQLLFISYILSFPLACLWTLSYSTFSAVFIVVAVAIYTKLCHPSVLSPSYVDQFLLPFPSTILAPLDTIPSAFHICPTVHWLCISIAYLRCEMRDASTSCFLFLKFRNLHVLAMPRTVFLYFSVIFTICPVHSSQVSTQFSPNRHLGFSLVYLLFGLAKARL